MDLKAQIERRRSGCSIIYDVADSHIELQSRADAGQRAKLRRTLCRGVYVNHQDHVFLLRHGVAPKAGLWADLGAGGGAFTLALAELLGEGGEIIALDRDPSALRRVGQEMASQYPGVGFRSLTADFTTLVGLHELDGVIMANSLHFVQNKEPTVRMIRGYLKKDGRLLIVEYNTDRQNRWVPYPISYSNWNKLASRCGFEHTTLMAKVPSTFLGEFYASKSW